MRRNFFICFLFLLALCMHSQAFALEISTDADEIYKIKNVKIENTSDDLVAGKQKAIDDGKKASFDSLIKRFISYGYIDKAITPTFEQIDDSIKSVAVIEELTLPKKYEARMNYEFDPAKILKLLNLKSIGVLPQKEAYLIVPVYNQDGQITPWFGAWFDAWKKFKTDSITIPLGDLEDMQTVTSADLSKLKYTGFDKLARRYKTPIIVMAKATYDVTKNVLTVRLIRFETEPKRVAEYTYPGMLGLGSKELFVTAANDIINRIKKDGISRDGKAIENTLADQDVDIEYYRDYQSEEHSAQKTLDINIPTRSLADWGAIRRKLINCRLINDVIVRAFSATETDATVYYIGEIEELQRSLALSDIKLVKQGDIYIIDRGQ